MGRTRTVNELGESVMDDKQEARRCIKERQVVQPTPSKARRFVQQQSAMNRRIQRILNRAGGNNGRTTRGSVQEAEWLGQRASLWVAGGHRTYYKQFTRAGHTYSIGDSVRICLLPGANPNYGMIVDMYQSDSHGHKSDHVKVAWLRPAKGQRELTKGRTFYMCSSLAKDYAPLDLSTIDSKVTMVPEWKWSAAAEARPNHYRLAYVEEGVGNLVKLNEKSAEWQFIAERRRGKPLEDEETVVLEADDTGESGASDEGSEYERSGDDEESEDGSSSGDASSSTSSSENDDSEQADIQRPKRRGTIRAKRPAAKRKLGLTDDEETAPAVKKRARPAEAAGVSRKANHKRTQIKLATAVSRATADGRYEQARSVLHVSAVPDELPCREDEFAQVYMFLEDKIETGGNGSMYISGVPGTGKSATVHEVVRKLQERTNSGELPEFKFVEVNGMQLADPMQVYTQIYQKLEGNRVAPKQALELLNRYFTQPNPRRECTVLLVDELDQLTLAKNTIMYELFNWPMSRHAHLAVITIANTMDLPERMMSQKPTAIELCARKIANATGDARRCLDMCRAAVELAEARDGLVEIKDVMEVTARFLNTGQARAVTHSSLHEKLWLLAVLLEFQRTGIEETTFGKVAAAHAKLCDHQAINIGRPTATIQSMACSRLAASKILALDDRSEGIFQRIRLCAIDMKTVKDCLRQDEALPKLLQ